jgi:hypothetical protein
MTEPEGWQVSGDAAEVYEKCFVPAIFGQWAPRLADAAKVASRDRVLDVGCGTGVLARTDGCRARRSGQSGYGAGPQAAPWSCRWTRLSSQQKKHDGSRDLLPHAHGCHRCVLQRRLTKRQPV